jgi:hypothetical protein
MVLPLQVSLAPKLRVTTAQTEHMPLHLRTFIRLLFSWVHRHKVPGQGDFSESLNSGFAGLHAGRCPILTAEWPAHEWPVGSRTDQLGLQGKRVVGGFVSTLVKVQTRVCRPHQTAGQPSRGGWAARLSSRICPADDVTTSWRGA